MAQVNVEVNGRPYAVGCEDGQERHLAELARMFDSQVRLVAQDMGQLGDTRLFLMGALLLADELADAKARLAGLEGEAAKAAGERERIEARAVAALEAAAQQIEKLAAE
jgi:cell division protein ZapA